MKVQCEPVTLSPNFLKLIHQINQPACSETEFRRLKFTSEKAEYEVGLNNFGDHWELSFIVKKLPATEERDYGWNFLDHIYTNEGSIESIFENQSSDEKLKLFQSDFLNDFHSDLFTEIEIRKD